MNLLDPGLWLGTVLSFCMIVFSGIAVYVGATALRSPAWEWCMQQLALYEVQLRAVGRDQELLPAELLAAEKMTGERDIPMPSDEDWQAMLRRSCSSSGCRVPLRRCRN